MTLTRPPRLVKPERETSILQLFRGNSCNEILLYRKSLAPRNTIRIWFGKAGAHPQLAWESQLPLKPYLSLQPFIFKGNCDSFDSLLDFCLISLNSFYLLRKCGLLAHTSAAFLKNCCTEKLFNCLWLILGIPSASGSARLGHIPSWPWTSQLPLKPYLLLQPFIFKGNCDSFDSLLDFCLISLNSFYLLRKCGLLAHTSAAFLKNCCTEKLFICLRLEICYLLSV